MVAVVNLEGLGQGLRDGHPGVGVGVAPVGSSGGEQGVPGVAVQFPGGFDVVLGLVDDEGSAGGLIELPQVHGGCVGGIG